MADGKNSNDKSIARFSDDMCKLSIQDAIAYGGACGLKKHLPEPFASGEELSCILGKMIRCYCDKDETLSSDEVEAEARALYSKASR